MMTTSEIAAEHGVTRQTVHAYRKRGVFPRPVEGEGSTRPRFRADEVAAFFVANPPSPGKRTDLASRDEGVAMWATEEPDPGPVIAPEVQENIQAAIKREAVRVAQAAGLAERDAGRIGAASLQGVRGLIEQWREAAKTAGPQDG